MWREKRTPRPDVVEKVERLGLTFHTLDGKPYWHEEAAYRFSAEEITELERATNQLHEMCLVAVEHVVETRSFDRLGIPATAWEPIAKTWDSDPPAIYGRFDLRFDGVGPPKLLEYNADTPTSLLEAAVVQWHWLQDVLPEADQFNSIWEGLVEKWHALKTEGYAKTGLIHFACMDAMEDLMTTAVMMDTAAEAGFDVQLLKMHEIGWDSLEHAFVDLEERRIETLFKLYPWEWLLDDPFAAMALKSFRKLDWIEPIWKMVLSNKGILAILWELFPGHLNLLPAYMDGPRDLSSYVRKPFLGREGANVQIHGAAGSTLVDGPYGGPHVFQAFAPLPEFDGNHAVIGSWVIDGEARGIGVRESDGPITEDHARFVPHYFQ